MCTVLLPRGDNPIAVNKYIISYHRIYSVRSTGSRPGMELERLNKSSKEGFVLLHLPDNEHRPSFRNVLRIKHVLDMDNTQRSVLIRRQPLLPTLENHNL